MQRLIQRIELADDVQRAVAESEDINEAFMLLDAAASGFEREQRPITLAEALEILRGVSRQIESLD